jgi:predicted CXXCH cytochrome family protein
MKGRGHLGTRVPGRPAWVVNAASMRRCLAPRARGTAIILAALLGLALALAACTESTKYRVLSVFFDGVPKPGQKPPEGAGPGGPGSTEAGPAPAPRPVTYVHPPFREDRCGACHDPTDGQLLRTPQQGLCQGCHSDVPGSAPFVHGPVAVGDCLFCHNPHASAYPNILLDDATALCFRCHDPADLTKGPYHATVGSQPCIDCHDPHAGRDRFFLKRNER